ncbi:mucosa-associated lymphoid tissue lymphoma translocation protein 1-like [Epargyreus clarus]|uniref:mucosa-associated lymphoid tissue lymphoma translocation protein 1-like n=1 Tax=Epargyreus clarus TaxID=520877 RepID=UPI003C2E9033
MSLLQSLSYPEYKNVCAMSKEQCDILAKLANLTVTYNDSKSPGEQLMKFLDRRGFSVSQFQQLVTNTLNFKVTYFRPQSKVAILIANDKYEHLSKLITPSIDCESLAVNLKELGFICMIIRNTYSEDLKNILTQVISQIPEDSYCFIFYAGHGCELCNTKCILSIDCPTENIEIDHCVTENWILREISKCKPELCVLIMDMCRMYLDRNTNLPIFAAVPFIEDYIIHSNLLIGYSAESSQAAYEVLQIECSTTLDNCVTYELKPGDTGRIVPGSSQYVAALCERLMENVDVSTLLDKVHADVENSMKKQRPIKVQCGVAKRSLYDPVRGNTPDLLCNLQEISEKYKECVSM